MNPESIGPMSLARRLLFALPWSLTWHLAAETSIAEEATPPLDEARLEAQQVVINRIVLDKQNVFDPSNPHEDRWLYRLANRLHIVTKDQVITDQLLLDSGDRYSKRLADESERILRNNAYFHDVSIKPVNQEGGTVDLLVATKDVWTLNPGFSFSRSGGENKTNIKLEDWNLLGRGQFVRVARTEGVDRISKSFDFRDRQIGGSWVSGRLRIDENSDGNARLVSLVRPFFALDTEWSAGARYTDNDLRRVLYDTGEPSAEYRQQRKQLAAFGGWSSGLTNGWVRRYTVGMKLDQSRFSNVLDATLPSAIPNDRKLVYPFFGVEVLQDSYAKTMNRDYIKRTEDVRTGIHVSATIGWSDRRFGADRDAWVYSASASRFLGSLEKTAVTLAGHLGGRMEGGEFTNSLLRLDLRYSHRFSEKTSFFATVESAFGNNLDLDGVVELGGASGLRGYPLRYQTGDSKLLLSLEQRYFWDYYPLRLVRVGGAIFADVGRTWGRHPLGGQELGWLRNVGVGFRFAPTRTGSRKIVHVDLAFPLDGDASIDDVQILVESKQSF